MLISVHMPKTAGLSFRATLEEHFGDAFLPDYEDFPLAHPPFERHDLALQYSKRVSHRDLGGMECIHGHFLPVKYLLLADQRPCRFVTWLRDPVERLVSHYHYWQRTYDPASDRTSSLHRRVVEEGWTLEEFCLAPELRNVYTQFLWAFPLQQLDFIGITESFDEDLRYFSRVFLGQEARPRYLNQRELVEEERWLGELTATVRAQVEAYHEEDIRFYQQALELRQRRLRGTAA